MSRALRETIEEIKRKKQLYLFKTSNLETLKETQTELHNNIESLRTDLKQHENVIFASKLLLEKAINTGKSKLEDFLTFSIQKIFYDRNYEIRLNLKEDSKKPGLDIVLVENDIEQALTDAVGGGILATLGLLLQIYYIEALGLSKVMFIDEGLKEVSKADSSSSTEDYLSSILDFLKFLSKERSYTFVLVTHDQDVIQKSDIVYRVNAGKVIKQILKEDAKHEQE